MFLPSSTQRLVRQSLASTRASYKSSPASRRFLTTEPPHKTSRSWKNSTARWAIAIGGVYWYNTSPIFNEQQSFAAPGQEAPLPTLESLSRSSRFAPPSHHDSPTLPSKPTSGSPPSIDPKSALPPPLDTPTQTPADLQAEAQQQGAFNEETGEINWDCPCLGGMAHGPCGEEFRAAFSCFVFSTDEPKGMDCVDKFKGMQTCFRAHPEEYGDQLEEDDDDVERELAEQELAKEGGEGGAMEGGESVAGAVEQGVASALKETASEGGIGADAAKASANGEDNKTKSESSTTSRSKPKRSIYDSESKEEAATEKDPKTDATNAKAASSSSKQDRETAGDQGGNLLPKAAHDASGEGVTTRK